MAAHHRQKPRKKTERGNSRQVLKMELRNMTFGEEELSYYGEVGLQPLVLVDTTNLPRDEWLKYRRKGIGGSDAAAVLGISPFMTAVICTTTNLEFQPNRMKKTG